VIARWLAAAPPPAGTIRERADEILGRQEFAREKPLLQRVLDWIGDQLSRFSFGVGSGPGFLGNLIGLVFIVGAIVLVVVLVRSFRRVPRKPAEPELSAEEEARRSASDWRSDAERFEAEGRWREAMRARYRELVRTLVDDNVLVDVPGRTTGEYRAELAEARPPASDPFGELTDLFEAAWYGGRDTGREENARFRELATVVRERTRELVGVS
jgi:hypothetical protein